MPSKSIQFFTDGVHFNLRDRNKVRLWLERVARKHSKAIDSLNYVFVSDQHLWQINRQFLHHDTFTDIITFPHHTANGLVGGEIYVSIDRVKENAVSFKVSFTNEVHRVMAHGLLHLCGFKDKTAREQSVMRSQEEKALDLRTF